MPVTLTRAGIDAALPRIEDGLIKYLWLQSIGTLAMSARMTNTTAAQSLLPGAGAGGHGESASMRSLSEGTRAARLDSLSVRHSSRKQRNPARRGRARGAYPVASGPPVPRMRRVGFMPGADGRPRVRSTDRLSCSAGVVTGSSGANTSVELRRAGISRIGAPPRPLGAALEETMARRGRDCSSGSKGQIVYERSNSLRRKVPCGFLMNRTPLRWRNA